MPSRLQPLRVLVLIGLIAAVLTPVRSAGAQRSSIVINEVVASNSSLVDDFGATPDWLELRNTGSESIDLAGWTLSDDDTAWALPAISIAADEIVLVWASDRNIAGPPPHTNFRLSAAGETLTLADADGALVDRLTYPTLGEDQAWGRAAGGIGHLTMPTPGTANSGLAPSIVTLTTRPQAFTGSLDVALDATLAGDESLRYTTDGSAVAPDSPLYGGPLTITTSTVVRAAVVDGQTVGPETTGGFIAISNELAGRASDLPIVLVHSTGAVGTTDQDAIVAVIDRSGDGQAYVLGDADYTGFAGLRIRGDSSSNFPKKQYKFELWDNPAGASRDGDLLGLGSDDDWGLYAPGRYDRQMIQNPFMYELGHRIGVPAPDYQFVELWLEDDETDVVGNGDYRGLYLLRETIEVDDERVDVVEHTPTSAGPDGGYIVRHDRPDSCCSTISTHLNGSSPVVAVNDPGADVITAGQLGWIDAWWDDLLAATASRSFSQISSYIDIDPFLDYWLLVLLSGDPDGLRLSTYMHKDADGLLRGGPLWDYDRTMGSADSRNNDLGEAEGWGVNDLLIDYDFFGDLWAVPEIQARLRARWNELRSSQLSDSAIVELTTMLHDEILSTYPAELSVWNGNGYGPRFGNGLTGEVAHMQQWLQRRLDWLDARLSSASTPSISDPGTISVDVGDAVNYQFAVDGGQAFAFDHTDLPAGVRLSDTGLLSGSVAPGDAETRPVTVTVTNELGGVASVTFTIDVAPLFSGPASVILNEYNAVAPGGLLDANGTDSTLGRVAGNGGDWFEIVVVEDRLDLRGWRFDVYTNTAGGVIQTAALRLGDAPLLADLRAGTIITIAESIPDDLSYSPRDGDWTLNLQANNAQAGALWDNQTSFDTNNTKWRLVVRDASLAVRGPVAGETEPWDDANFGVSSAEVMHLAVDPTAIPNTVTDYRDSTSSSFGAPNPIGVGVLQDFSLLRPAIRDDGNVNCDASMNIVDALVIAQYTVGTRTASSCPLTDPAKQIDLSGGDIDDNGVVDIVDALVISRCTVGLDDGLCTPD